MEKISRKYERKWYSFSKGTLVDWKPLSKQQLLKNPNNYLPEALTLNEKEEAILVELEKSAPWSSDDFRKMQKLKTIKYSALSTSFLAEEIQKIKEQAQNLAITLPPFFINFFENPNLLGRIRWEHTFLIYYTDIVPFPDNENLFIMTLVTENQGCCYWFLLMDKKGNHCILFNFHHWKEYAFVDKETETPFKYYIVAYSFEEFIIRLSQDLIKLETLHPYPRYF